MEALMRRFVLPVWEHFCGVVWILLSVVVAVVFVAIILPVAAVGWVLRVPGRARDWWQGD